MHRKVCGIYRKKIIDESAVEQVNISVWKLENFPQKWRKIQRKDMWNENEHESGQQQQQQQQLLQGFLKSELWFWIFPPAETQSFREYYRNSVKTARGCK